MLRALRQAVGRDNLRRNDLVMYALMPGPDGRAWLWLPNTFDLPRSVPLPCWKMLASPEVKAASDHMCCAKTSKECGRPQNPMNGNVADLHWTVQAQLLQRGGLKSGPKVAVGDIDDRISALRAAAKASDAPARAKSAKGAGDRRGGSAWAPPAVSRDVDFTAAEQDLAELVK